MAVSRSSPASWYFARKTLDNGPVLEEANPCGWIITPHGREIADGLYPVIMGMIVCLAGEQMMVLPTAFTAVLLSPTEPLLYKSKSWTEQKQKFV